MSHPLRQRIVILLLRIEEAGAAELAAALEEAPARVEYHLRLLFRQQVLKAVHRCRPAPHLYRFSPQARWARKFLPEDDE